MLEVELKFQIPLPRRAAVAAAVAGAAGAPALRLAAAYFDTADRALARAAVALRLRREGRLWVQTLKAASDDGIARLEHNVPLPGRAAEPPALAPPLHAGTPAGERLEAALAAAADPALECLYRTEIRRLHRAVRTRHGRVELACDSGSIRAGTARLAVHELEIELLSGSPLAVIDAARRWVARHGLWLDTRSKAERGDLLARAQACAAERKARRVELQPGMSWAEARRVVLASCFDQVSVNASSVASGSYLDEHVHQLRVGLRRLRTALRLFDAEPLPLAEQAADLFRALGAARDAAAIGKPLREALAGAMAGAGLALAAPALPAGVGDDPAVRLRGSPAQLFLLDLLAELHAPLAQPQQPAEPLADALAGALNRLHRKVAADALRFGELDDEARHLLRKRAKRLRYAVEFAASLFDKRAVRRYLESLRELQERLGALNDVAVGLQAFRPAAAEDPAAAFALGWLAARREQLAADCAPALAAFAKVPRFWRD